MKQCVICKQEIIEKKDKWVRLTDFDCEMQTGEVYYHLECWQERFQITNSARKKQMYTQMGRVVKNIKDKLDKGGMVVSTQ